MYLLIFPLTTAYTLFKRIWLNLLVIYLYFLRNFTVFIASVPFLKIEQQKIVSHPKHKTAKSSYSFGINYVLWSYLETI